MTYSVPQSWSSSPFLSPRTLSLVGSGITEVDTKAGPAFQHRVLAQSNSGIPERHNVIEPTQRTGAIKALGEAPLRLRKLATTARHIIGCRITQDIRHSLVYRNIFGSFSNDNSKLRLIVASVILLSDGGQRCLGWPRVTDTSSRFSKQFQHLEALEGGYVWNQLTRRLSARSAHPY